MATKHIEYLVCKSYRCKKCSNTGQTYGYIKGDDFDMESFDPCEKCGSTDISFLLSVPNIDRFDERFPYFDRGLGMMLHSKKHRRQVCKERNLVPVDGDIDFSSEVNKIEQKHKEEDKIVSDLNDRVANHPGYAEYRKQKAQGWKPKFTHRDQGEAPGMKKIDPFNEE